MIKKFKIHKINEFKKKDMETFSKRKNLNIKMKTNKQKKKQNEILN